MAPTNNLAPLDQMVIPPLTFGDGWLTANAADLAKIAIAFGNFDVEELILTIHKIHKGDGKANMTTVCNALQIIQDAHAKADPELYKDIIEAKAKAQEALGL